VPTLKDHRRDGWPLRLRLRVTADTHLLQERMAVVAVVLNWNGLDDTLACVDSLARQTYQPLSVLVVDNGSRLSPRARMAALHPTVEVIENDRNLGYTGGNNVGIRMALVRGAELVWILSNDTTVEPETLAHLVETARRHPDAAVIGGKVLRMDRPGTLWMTWGRVPWLQSLIALEGWDAPDDGTYDGECAVPWIPGCSMLLRAEALRRIGVLDEQFFAYHEDVEWAARAREAGWSVWFTGAARTYHAVHGSSGGERHYGGFWKYLSARNGVLYAKRHGHLWQMALMAAAIAATLPFQFARRWRPGEQEGVALKPRGWRDGLLGRPIPFAELGLV
jgi:GT2 family glycosyltransferase